jgi:hypothetical protein
MPGTIDFHSPKCLRFAGAHEQTITATDSTMINIFILRLLSTAQSTAVIPASAVSFQRPRCHSSVRDVIPAQAGIQSPSLTAVACLSRTFNPATDFESYPSALMPVTVSWIAGD